MTFVIITKKSMAAITKQEQKNLIEGNSKRFQTQWNTFDGYINYFSGNNNYYT